MTAPSAKPDRPLRLLVVEDEALIAMTVEDMLDKLGHRVLGVAAGVADALAMIDELRRELDGAVLDANLGGRSATPVAERLRALAIPFVVASGYEDDELDGFGYPELKLRKPYTARQMDVALRNAVG